MTFTVGWSIDYQEEDDSYSIVFSTAERGVEYAITGMSEEAVIEIATGLLTKRQETRGREREHGNRQQG